MWATARLKLETYFEYVMNNKMFDLEQGNIQLSRKTLDMFSTETPEYLLLIKNWEEIDSIKNKLNSEMGFNE